MATVSVIVPNYNHAEFLKQRIDSILDQSYRDFELILLDDCSTDSSGDIIEQYRHHDKVSKIVYNNKNSGSTFIQWNKGVSLANGQYIWLAESDDFAGRRFLEHCMNEFTRQHQLTLVYTDSKIVDENNLVIHEDLSFWTDDISVSKWGCSYIKNGCEEIKEALSKKNTIPNASAVVFRKIFFNEVLGYRFCGDWMFWIKVLETGNMAFIKQPLNFFRSHSNTTRFNPSTNYRFKQFLKERIMILHYLKTNQLISKDVFQKQKDDVIRNWRSVFTLMGMLKKDFFLPFHDPGILINFFAYKFLNAFKRLSKFIFHAKSET